MRRWRTVGLIGVETSDQRLIEGTVSIRSQGEVGGWTLVPLLWGRERFGHAGPRCRELVAVRVEGGRIEAFLRRRHRAATPSFDGRSVMRMKDGRSPATMTDGARIWIDNAVYVLTDPPLVGLCGPTPSAWAELR